MHQKDIKRLEFTLCLMLSDRIFTAKLGLSQSLMVQGGMPNLNPTLKGYPKTFCGLFGQKAHKTQQITHFYPKRGGLSLTPIFHQIKNSDLSLFHETPLTPIFNFHWWDQLFSFYEATMTIPIGDIFVTSGETTGFKKFSNWTYTDQDRASQTVPSFRDQFSITQHIQILKF